MLALSLKSIMPAEKLVCERAYAGLELRLHAIATAA